MQPEFNRPEFLEGNSAEEIHERMMNNLPDDIDDMPGGFPYDMTMPAALEKDEIINFHIVRALMIAFPEYAWDEWLDKARSGTGFWLCENHSCRRNRDFIRNGILYGGNRNRPVD